MNINSDTREYEKHHEKTFHIYMLDDNKIILHNESIIRVQIGKNSSAYKDTYTFKALDFPRAVMYYNGINIGKGYKKRLKCDTLNKPILARQLS